MKTDCYLPEHHLFSRLGKHIFFNVETMLFYEVTPPARDLISCISKDRGCDPIKALKGKYPRSEIRNTFLYLSKEGLLKEAPSNSIKPILKKRWGIRHLELMVTHGCNMGCRYCYGASGPEQWKDAPHLYGSSTAGMSLETAKKGVDFLFKESGDQKDLSVIFFGGEPLLEFSLIQKIVPYIREREQDTGRKVDLSISTNGLLLTERVVRFLNKHKIGCQVSIDGNREIQDINRCLPGGRGSYAHVVPGINRLIATRKGRVPARVTVAHNQVNIPAVIEHLLQLGFGSIHVEPAIGSTGESVVSNDDIKAIKAQNEVLALYLVKSVRNNRYFNYTNLVKFIRHTRVIRERLAYYCGAGRTYFSLSQDGAFYPCHRFVGMEQYKMGDLENGPDFTLQKKILSLTVDNRPLCAGCWSRYLCGGGCWKHAVDLKGCLEVPDNELSCEVIRHEIECSMAINSELDVTDQEILSELYEETAEPYLKTDGFVKSPKMGNLSFRMK
jgi:uncharacterized protein